jgi:clan AA aspartic protease (TIGR02281 family)
MLSFAAMRFNPLYLALLLCLCLLGTWGLLELTQNNNWPQMAVKVDSAVVVERQLNQQAKTKISVSSQAPTVKALADSASEKKSDMDAFLLKAQALLLGHYPQQAAQYIESIYSQISSQDLNEFKRLFYQQASIYQKSDDVERQKQLSMVAGDLFDDMLFWDNAVYLAISQKDWSNALVSLRRSTSLENQPDVLQKKLFELVKVASHLRAHYETLGDQLGIKALYQELYDEHPSYPRFQLELAQSHLRLGNKNLAQPLLKQLQYDPELGAIAKQKLTSIEERDSTAVIARASDDLDRKPTDMVVPLRRVGNSLVVAGSVNGRSVSLLLDTGASITALSQDLISRLDLQATGNSVQLSTANGVTRSRLYRISKMRLGRVFIQDAVVAEIDLRASGSFQGLLGTDILNNADPRYSYVIDNSKNALIFRRK